VLCCAVLCCAVLLNEWDIFVILLFKFEYTLHYLFLHFDNELIVIKYQ